MDVREQSIELLVLAADQGGVVGMEGTDVRSDVRGESAPEFGHCEHTDYARSSIMLRDDTHLDHHQGYQKSQRHGKLIHLSSKEALSHVLEPTTGMVAV